MVVLHHRVAFLQKVEKYNVLMWGQREREREREGEVKIRVECIVFIKENIFYTHDERVY